MGLKKDVLDSINYYIDVTGDSVSQCLENMSKVSSSTDSDLVYKDWLAKQVLKLIKSRGVSLDEVIKNKDLIMSSDVKEEDGSFYTPLEWALVTHEMTLRHIPNLEDYIVWDASCGSGNLLQDLPKCKELFVSTLHQEDAEIVQARLPHAHAFQLDFLQGIDYNEYVTEFTDKLPERLQEALRNNEPILFLMNPPYSVTNAQKTQVSKHLRSIGKTDIGNDLLRQFIWRVYNLVEIHNLTNSYFTLIGTNSLYILPSWESTLKEMHDHADYLEGFTYPASEFAGVNKSVKWGIFTTIWKTRSEFRDTKVLPTIEMDEMKKDSNGEIQKLGKLEFVWNKKYITEWLKGKITEGTKVPIPSAQSKGEVRLDADGNPKVYTGLSNAVAYFMTKDSFKSITNQNGLSTVPITSSDIPATMENIKDLLATYAFTTTFQEDFEYSARPFREPVTGTDEYKEWVANAIFFAVCARKSYLSSFRRFKFNNEERSINCSIFPLSKDEVRQHCNDELILKDLEENDIDNQWYLDLLKESEHLLWDGVRDLFNTVTNFIKMSYNHRNKTGYDVHTVAWNAGFLQLRYTSLWNEDMEKAFSDLYSVARKEFRDRAKTHFIV